MPRQGPVFGFELQALPFAAMAILLFSGKVLLGYWVYRDASARGSSVPRWWGLAVAILDPLVLGYLFTRWRKLGEREYPRTSRDRSVATALVALFGSLLLATETSPPDPLSQPRYFFGALVVVAPLAYLLVYRDGWARFRARF